MARKYHSEIMAQAVLETYLKPLSKIIERRAKYYLFLIEKDIFEMSDEDAKKHQARMQEVGLEIEQLTSIGESSQEMWLLFQRGYSELERELIQYKHLAYQLSLDVITFKQALVESSNWESFLLEHSINTLKSIRTI